MSFFGGILKGIGSAAKFVGKIGAAGATSLSHIAGSVIGIDPVQIGHDVFDKKPSADAAYTASLPQTPTLQLLPSTATPPYLGSSVSYGSTSSGGVLDSLANGLNSLFGKVNLPVVHVEGDIASPTKSNWLPWVVGGVLLLIITSGGRGRR